MSAANKLRGGKSELTRLKGLPASDRAEVFSWKEESASTNADLRARLLERHGIRLSRDGQLSEFWQWQFRQAAIDRLGEMMAQDEQLLQDKFPGLSRDAIRDAAIKRGYAMADLSGDVELSLKVAKTDLKDAEGARDSRKLALLEAEAERARLTEAVIDSGVSPEEQAKRIREIFHR
jgi:hypothetical protein